MNNARVVTLMEEARLLWLNRRAASAGVESFSHPKFVVALNVDFLKPISYGPALELCLAISRIGTSSFTVSYEASQDTHTVFRASTVLVVIDRSSGRPRALHAEEIAYLTGYTTLDHEANNIGETND
ncbi:acyl-CoA thioester hydrolase [Arthrobacter sp. CAN_A214]